MAAPYVGQILMFAGNYPPEGYALCDGSSLQISAYDTLFSLIGTTYGGDGVNTFNLPDLRSRVPVHYGTSAAGVTYTFGTLGGTENVTLSAPQIPVHTHLVSTTGAGGSTNTPSPSTYFADQSTGDTIPVYAPGSASNTVQFGASVGATGGSQPHSNIQPYLAINYYIAVYGVFPTSA